MPVLFPADSPVVFQNSAAVITQVGHTAIGAGGHFKPAGRADHPKCGLAQKRAVAELLCMGEFVSSL